MLADVGGRRHNIDIMKREERYAELGEKLERNIELGIGHFLS